MLKDAAGHTMEELTGVCRQETCSVEKALKNGSEEASVKCRDQGAARDLITAAYNQGGPGDGSGFSARSLRGWASDALAESCSCSRGDPGTVLDRGLCKRIPGAGARNVSWAGAQQPLDGFLFRKSLSESSAQNFI